MNFSNPFYVNPKFDYDGLMSFCTNDSVRQKDADIESQINRFKYDGSPRTALHAYRILMVPLYFIENRKFKLNIFEINGQDAFGFSELNNLKAAYNLGHSSYNRKKVLSDLEYLHNLCKEKIAKLPAEKPDMEKAKIWLKNVKGGLLQK